MQRAKKNITKTKYFLLRCTMQRKDIKVCHHSCENARGISKERKRKSKIITKSWMDSICSTKYTLAILSHSNDFYLAWRFFNCRAPAQHAWAKVYDSDWCGMCVCVCLCSCELFNLFLGNFSLFTWHLQLLLVYHSFWRHFYPTNLKLSGWKKNTPKLEHVEYTFFHLSRTYQCSDRIIVNAIELFADGSIWRDVGCRYFLSSVSPDSYYIDLGWRKTRAKASAIGQIS